MWEELTIWVSNNIATFISLLISAVSVWYACRANKISKEANNVAEKSNQISADANKKSDKANKIAIDANNLSKEANNIARNENELVKHSSFNQFYKQLNKIKRYLSKILEQLNYKSDVKQAGILANELNDILLDIIKDERNISLPLDAYGIFEDIHTENIKIKGKIDNLISMVVVINEDYNERNDGNFIEYKREILTPDLQKKFDEKIEIIDEEIGNLHRFINFYTNDN